MKTSVKLVLLVMVAAVMLSGCAEIIGAMIPETAYVQPASGSKMISANSGASAMKAAIAAASANNWTPKTISSESGYLLAERDTRVAGRAERSDSFKLEINVPMSGKGEVSVKVTPPPRVMGGVKTDQMVSDYLAALDTALVAK